MQSSAMADPDSQVREAYGRWAPIYDLVFDLPFRRARRAAALAVADAASEGEALVVGVGTGLELPLLPRDLDVTGIDLSAPMLDVAKRRATRLGLNHVKSLRLMDAAALEFHDHSFDVVVAPFVMSVVPDPARVIEEMWRVLKPGGQLVLMNHYAAERGVRAHIERAASGAGAWLGWKPNFPFAAVGGPLAALKDARTIERREVAPLRLFTLLRIEKAAGL